MAQESGFPAGRNLCDSQGSKKGDRFIHPAVQDANGSPSVSFRANRRGPDSPRKGSNRRAFSFFSSSFSLFVIAVSTIIPSRK